MQLKNLRIEKYGHKVGRNEKCPCGSGKKYKSCCYEHTRELIDRAPMFIPEDMD